jgi:hypothetical protein
VELGSVFRIRLIIAMSEVNASPSGRRFYFLGAGQMRSFPRGAELIFSKREICTLIY